MGAALASNFALWWEDWFPSQYGPNPGLETEFWPQTRKQKRKYYQKVPRQAVFVEVKYRESTGDAKLATG